MAFDASAPREKIRKRAKKGQNVLDRSAARRTPNLHHSCEK
jgi:hypothetical protein